MQSHERPLLQGKGRSQYKYERYMLTWECVHHLHEGKECPINFFFVTLSNMFLNSRAWLRRFSCVTLTLWAPVDCSPPGSSIHGASPGKNTGVGRHFPLQGIFNPGWNQRLLHFLYCRQVLCSRVNREAPSEFTEVVISQRS